MATALFAAYLSIQRRLQCIVPDKRATPNLNCGGVSNFAQSSPKFKRAMRPGNNRASSRRPRLQGDYLADRGCLVFDVCLKPSQSPFCSGTSLLAGGWPLTTPEE